MKTRLRRPNLRGVPRCPASGKYAVSLRVARLMARSLRESGGSPSVYKCSKCRRHHVSGERSL